MAIEVFNRSLLYFVLANTFIVATLSVFYYYNHSDANAYLAASIDKQQLLKKSAAPRLILIGGSNVAFGFDSAELRRGLHLQPVNMGLNAGLGLAFMLNEVEAHLQPNDIVLIAPEFEHFGAKYFGEVETLFDAVLSNPDNLKFLSLMHGRVLLDQGLRLLGQIARSVWRSLALHAKKESVAVVASRIYSRSSFNEFGDIVVPQDQAPRSLKETRIFEIDAVGLKRAIERLNSFHKTARNLGVTVWFAHPPVTAAAYKRHRRTFDRLENSLRQSLSIPVLNPLEQMVFPNELFFDSAYHLNSRGAHLRSRQIIEAMQRSYVTR